MIKAGETKTLSFNLPANTFRIINEQNKREIAPGVFSVSVGGGQPGVSKKSSNVVSAELSIK